MGNGPLKFVEGDLLVGHAELGEHFGAGFNHHRRAAQVELHGFRVGVSFEIVNPHGFVDKAGVACPVILAERIGEGKLKVEVVVLCREFSK
jgi:hypothetical protein